jgi:hypothetical protein
MKRSCFSKKAFFILALLAASLLWGMPGSVALYYGSTPFSGWENFHDWTVVDPDSLDVPPKRRTKVIAYVGLEEAAKSRSYFPKIDKRWVIGENRIWKSVVLDLRQEGYREFLTQYIEALFERGFDGVMFDTVDSYLSYLEGEQRRAYEKAIVSFVKGVKSRHRDKLILLNRGFEVIGELKKEVDGFVVESLYRGIETKGMRYCEVTGPDRSWLLKQARTVQSFGIPVVIVDYVDPKKAKLREETAQKIAEEGFLPWVCDKHLKTFGQSTRRHLPRDLLLLHDAASYSAVHRMVSMPAEYLGYVPKLHAIEKGLPEGYLNDRYAGAVIWLDAASDTKAADALQRWAAAQIKNGFKLLFLGDFGFPVTPKSLAPLGIDVAENPGRKPVLPVLQQAPAFYPYEAKPRYSYQGYYLQPRRAKALLTFGERGGDAHVAAAITSWGGYALSGALLQQILDNDLWAVNPFELIRNALALTARPVPDVTTENGRRIAFAHIDGDGFIERAEWERERFAPQIIRDRIIKRHPHLPHSVSVIEGEISKTGLYPELSGTLEPLARSIFALDNVEIASHSYSHPFNWEKVLEKEAGGEGEYHLKIKGYDFSLEREITGSVAYIDAKLAPKGKRAKSFFWTGDCLPSAEALKIVYDDGLLNMNGGDTTITRLHPFLSYIAPMGREKGGYFQVYAPMQNENVYTNNWQGPFYGYANVIQTFELTDAPRRLKPIDVYYHFYSGSKSASLKALEKVYDWVQMQQTTPMFASEWIRKAMDFRKAATGVEDNATLVYVPSSIRTLRYDLLNGYPDLKRSKGIIGYSGHNDQRYLHLDGSGSYRVVMQKRAPKEYSLVYGNGVLRSRSGSHYVFESHPPLRVVFRNFERCDVQSGDAFTRRETQSGTEIAFGENGIVEFSIACR